MNADLSFCDKTSYNVLISVLDQACRDTQGSGLYRGQRGYGVLWMLMTQ